MPFFFSHIFLFCCATLVELFLNLLITASTSQGYMRLQFLLQIDYSSCPLQNPLGQYRLEN
jgi:general stress protein CsbA